MNDAIMICGGDSMIGAGLAQRMRDAGNRVIVTSRRAPNDSDAVRHLDLANLPDHLSFADVRTMVICAAIARIEMCEKDPAAAYQVNVAGTCRIAEQASKDGCHVVFLSTNQVFDGSQAYCRENCPPSPMTEYGRQKAQTEKWLLEAIPGAAVLRLTKVFGQTVGIFDQWAASLRKGETIRPFYDMPLAPIPLSSVVSVLQLICANRCSGIYQLAGEKDRTYSDVALALATHLNISPALVQPVSSADVLKQRCPLHTTLSVTRVVQEFGLTPPGFDCVLQQTFAAMRS